MIRQRYFVDRADGTHSAPMSYTDAYNDQLARGGVIKPCVEIVAPKAISFKLFALVVVTLAATGYVLLGYALTR